MIRFKIIKYFNSSNLKLIIDFNFFSKVKLKNKISFNYIITSFLVINFSLYNFSLKDQLLIIF